MRVTRDDFVITDAATFAYLADVYVLEVYRGRQLGQWLMTTVIAYPDLRGLRRFAMVTRDAHAWYARCRNARLAIHLFSHQLHMIRIEHIAVWTDDVERLAAFYATYFNALVGERYVNPIHGFTSRFLTLGDGARFELMATTRLEPVRHDAGAQRMGLTHFAVSVGSEGAVNALTGRLERDGYMCADQPRRTGDGYYESVILDPDGNRIEITV